MKKLYALLAALCATPVMMAGYDFSLQGTAFTADTTAHFVIAPGVTHTALVCRAGSRTFNAFVITMDRKAPGAENVRPKVEIGRDSCVTAEAITSMAKRKTGADAQYVAALNGDFFITSAFSAQHPMGNRILGYPNMSCATDGKIASPDIIDYGSREKALIVARDGNMYIDATDLSYTFAVGDNTLRTHLANYMRTANDVVAYNSYNGGWTHTDATGRELILDYDGEWCFNRPMTMTVRGWDEDGNAPIPANGMVLSFGANGETHDWIENLRPGDKATFTVNCSLPAFGGLTPDILEICGGDVRILREGTVTKQGDPDAIRFINTPTSQYSRSLVGYSKDRSLLVLCAVDAGGSSSGVSYYEGADLMAALGCYDALDLDGGGSTAMWAPTHGFLNTPRDGAERAVGNGLFVRMDTPADTEVATIRFADPVLTLPKNGLYQPVIYGYNKYGQLVDTDVRNFTLSAPGALGTVSDDGTALLASGSGTHALTATRNGSTATIAVTVDDTFAAAPRVDKVLMQRDMTWDVELQAKVGTQMMAVTPQAYSWTSSDPAVAQISADGTVTAKADGAATLTGTLGETALTVDVTVETPVQEAMNIYGNPFDAEGWTFSGTGVDKKSFVLTADNNGFDTSFKVTSTRNTNMTLSKQAVLWSRPTGLSLDLTPGDFTVSKVIFNVQPANAKASMKLEAAGPFAANTPVSLSLPFGDLVGADVTDIAFYPVTVRGIQVYVSAKSGTHTLAMPAVQAKYASLGAVDTIVADGDSDADAPARYYNLQGMPVSNPGPGIYILRRGRTATKVLIR